MRPYKLIEQLRQLPEDQRTKFATDSIGLVGSLGHSIQDIVTLLPVLDRAEFIKSHLNAIESPYVFSLVLSTLPDESRLEFANQHYSFFTLERRRSSAALGCILSLLPEKDRVDFALRHGNEVEGASDWLLKSVLRALPQENRFAFAARFLSTVFLHAASTIEILQLLEGKDRLKFYLLSKGAYLAFNELAIALNLIPSSDVEQFLEINTQRMLMTFEASEAICHILTAGDRHPIYYSLQRAFNAIASDQTDEKQKTRTYAVISDFFNARYSINSKPYDPLHDDQYIYLRNLESKAVSSLVQKAEPSFLPATVDLITQYSGHYVDPQQCRERTSELRNLSQDDLTWDDLVYLHKNTLGLRGVTDDDMAINEATYGGRGDAISLANFGMGKEKDLEFSILVNETTMDEKHPQKKSALLKSLQEGLRWHIHICFNYGYSVAFELISKGSDALYPDDFGDTYRLGKCGTANINTSQIKKVILRKDCSVWDIESVYRFIVADIKQLRLPQEQLRLSESSTVDHQAGIEFDESIVEKMKKQPQQYNPKLFTGVSTSLPAEPVNETWKFPTFSCVIL